MPFPPIFSWLCCYMAQMNPLVGPILEAKALAAIHYHCWLAGTYQTTLRLRGLTGVVCSGPCACAGAQAAHARHSLAAHAACCQPLRL